MIIAPIPKETFFFFFFFLVKCDTRLSLKERYLYIPACHMVTFQHTWEKIEGHYILLAAHVAE